MNATQTVETMIGEHDGKVLEFKWTVSRGRDSYGYNICSLYVNRSKVTTCNGGGYDMKGTCLGNWITKTFPEELKRLKQEFYGLSWHDPRYQAFYSASNKLPTERHVIPLLDGACGFSQMEKILKAIGYHLKWITESKNSDTFILEASEE